MTRRLPPLNALKTFEASARLGSFVLAAAELHVTPGAVSQQIKKLEDFFGRQLFIRNNNQLLLTDVGLTVQAAGADMMNCLASLTQRLLMEPVRSRLIVSVLPSVGVRWLNRRLPEFLRAQPNIRVDLHTAEDPVDFFSNRIDVRISYGEHLYPEFITAPFLKDHVTVMCAPEFIEDGRIDPASIGSLRDEDLIHVSWRRGFSSYPTWESWFAGAGEPRRPRGELGHTTDTSSLGIDLACAGCGVVLGQTMLAEDELASGRLVMPFAARMPLQYAYCAVYTRANAHSPAVEALVAWLKGMGR
ncbi:MAG: LysR family transcriptional regulator [Gammaproteobacteria bacterium]|nr:LysR family transcriptional regulator [Gammaproteobacteria bacterium]MDE2349974.1 LysR family transcriptional regulator [Gammaproteobacteria bacterium]